MLVEHWLFRKFIIYINIAHSYNCMFRKLITNCISFCNKSVYEHENFDETHSQLAILLASKIQRCLFVGSFSFKAYFYRQLISLINILAFILPGYVKCISRRGSISYFCFCMRSLFITNLSTLSGHLLFEWTKSLIVVCPWSWPSIRCIRRFILCPKYSR